jgi:acetyltransferase-like isoleucine patch superfamily enzyme
MFFPLTSVVQLLIVVAGPIVPTALLVTNTSGVARAIALAAAPIVYVLLYPLLAGLLSLPHQKSVVAGKFARDLTLPAYRGRRQFGLLWTAVYYAVPIYFVWLSVPFLKRLLFALFGYRGSSSFTLYPDTWIRDLPLLRFGAGAYVSNRATLGTNVVLRSGEILVDTVSIGDRALVGHLSMLGPGVVVSDDAEVGIGCAIGFRTRLGAGSQVGPCCTVEHSVVVGPGTTIGTRTYVGSRVRLGPNLRIPAGCVVPAGTRLRTQADVDALFRGRAASIPEPELAAEAS